MVAREIPDKDPDKFPKLKANYKQIKTRLLDLSATVETDTPKQSIVKIGLILNDIRQILRLMNGIHKDDE